MSITQKELFQQFCLNNVLSWKLDINTIRTIVKILLHIWHLLKLTTLAWSN